MKNINLGIALFLFVIAILSASHAMHWASTVSAIAAAFNFVLYKLES